MAALNDFRTISVRKQCCFHSSTSCPTEYSTERRSTISYITCLSAVMVYQVSNFAWQSDWINGRQSMAEAPIFSASAIKSWLPSA